MLGLVPLPPLPDQDTETAKKQLEIFRNEAASILGEANAAGDLTAPLAVAAAEAEALTLDQLGMLPCHATVAVTVAVSVAVAVAFPSPVLLCCPASLCV